MTNDELDRLAASAEVAFAGTRIGVTTTKERFEAITAVCTNAPALVAEVRRLRGVVREAYEEGLSDGIAGHGDPWEVTAAKRALDGAA